MYVREIYRMERLFLTNVRKIYIMERTMELFSQIVSSEKREYTCQTGQRTQEVWNPVQVSGRGTSKAVSNPGRVGLHKRLMEISKVGNVEDGYCSKPSLPAEYPLYILFKTLSIFTPHSISGYNISWLGQLFKSAF